MSLFSMITNLLNKQNLIILFLHIINTCIYLIINSLDTLYYIINNDLISFLIFVDFLKFVYYEL